MKYIIFILIILLLPYQVFANSISELKFEVVSNPEKYCLSENVMGCIVYENKTIYINSNNPSSWQSFVIAHEICHWLIENQPRKWQDDELTCDNFSLWIYYPMMYNSEDSQYFKSLIQ